MTNRSHLPPAALKILRALSTYHFLTKPQMVDLGLAKSVASLDNHAIPYLAPKRDKQTGEEILAKGQYKSSFLCHSLTYGLRDDNDKPGKNHFMYYLTQAGLDRVYWEFEAVFEKEGRSLQNDPIWRPSEHEHLSNDYHHRRHYVSAHIAIRDWAMRVGASIDFWQHYYQADPKRPKSRGRPPSVNRVLWDEIGRRYCTPDGILGITHQGKSRVYILELHHRTPPQLVVDQLYRDFRAARSVRGKFLDYPTKSDPYVLSVFTDPADMGAVQKQVGANDVFDAVRQGLISASIDQLTSVLHK